MGCMILSNGRSGTNLLLSMLANHKFFDIVSPYPEDKNCWFDPNIRNSITRLAKSDTHYILNFYYLEQYLKNNSHMKIIWTIRDPRDQAMSKIRRGYGRDSYDASFEGCIADMFHMFRLFLQLKKYYPEKVKVVKMEDLIMNPSDTLKDICKFLKINYTDDLLDIRKNMAKKNLLDRYNGLDKSQVSLYKDWQNVYCGFLKNIDFNMEDLFIYLKPIIEYFEYEV